MIYTDEFIKAGKFDQNDMFIKDNLVYECIAGSHAYGCNNKDSDIDAIGIFMDRHQDLYPTQYGFILGFDQLQRYQQKEIKGENKRIILTHNNTDCEMEWHSLCDFFYKVGVKGSPNMFEAIFVRNNFITYSNNIGYILRDNRHKFISMRTYFAFKGYSISQMHRVKQDIKRGKTENPRRQIYLDKFGMDVKMCAHVLRLTDQMHQILTDNDIDLQRIREEIILMRNGEWGDFNKFEAYINNKLLKLEDLAMKVPLPSQPRTSELHQILQNCIEEFYGSIDNSLKTGTEYISAKDVMTKLQEIEAKVEFLSSKLLK